MNDFIPYQSDFPHEIQHLQECLRDADKRRQRLTLEGTPLSIGVMGQVKAGKSSFLNGLLFQGRTLLPEAATPKTANLTRIRHAQRPSFTAHFYSPQDWAKIEDKAQSPLQDEATRAAKELVQSAEKSGLNIAQLLQEGHIHLEANSIDELLGQLNQYVGGDGQLTALVAETELALPIDELKGIEVVDTPGMNDPVISRTQKTREYMSQCDVVFFLSRASQFLDESDQGLMAQQLPQKGIKRLILVAAQMDAAILDDGFNRRSLDECYTRTESKLTKHAQTIFQNLAQDRQKQGKGDAAQMLLAVEHPIFASTHARLICELPEQDWPSGVRHTYQEIKDLAENNWQTKFQAQDWERLANTSALSQAFEQARNDKEALLAQQRTKLNEELASNWADALQQLQERAESRIQSLETEDLNTLAKKEASEQAALDGISHTLGDYLQGIAQSMQERNQKLTQELQHSATRASRLDERTGTSSEKHSRMVSDAIWFKPWTWFSKHEESWRTSKSYSYLAAADAAENVRNYFHIASQQLHGAFDDLASPTTISAGLRRELLRHIDSSKEGFDPRSVRSLVESSLSGLQLPQLQFEAPNTDDAFAGFSAEVKSSADMSQLQDKLQSTMHKLQQNLMQNMQKAVSQSSTALQTISDQLHQQLTARLQQEIAQLRAQIQDKEQHIQRLQSLLQIIQAAR